MSAASDPRLSTSVWLAAGTAALAYLPSLRFGLVWDDPMLLGLVDQRMREGGLSHLLTSEFLLGSGTLSTGYYRPVVLLSFLLDGRWGGHSSWAYHATNLLLHVACSLLVLLLARNLLGPRGAVVAALLFALHPVHVEAVAFVSGRTDLWATLFVLASTALWMRCRERGEGAFGLAGIASAICLLAGMFSKEVAVLLPAALLAWEALSERKHRQRSWASWLVLWTGAAAIFFAVRYGVAGVGWGAAPDVTTAPPDIGFLPLLMLRGIAYLRLLAIPWPLSPYYTVTDLHPAIASIAGASIAVATMGLACALVGRRIGWKGVAWTCIFVAPVLGVRPLAAAVVAERFLYLPSVGYCLVLAALYVRLRSIRATVVDAGTLVLLVACAAGTVVGETTWQNDETLFTRMTRSSPRAFVAHFNLGNTRTLEGRLPEAEAEFVAAVDIAPGRSDAWNNLGAVHERRGDVAGAVEAYRKARDLGGGASVFRLNFPKALMLSGHYAEAEVEFRRVLAADPGSRDARTGLAGALEAQRRYREAAEALGPGNEFDLPRAKLHAKAGDAATAIAILRRASTVRPDDAEILLQLGMLLAQHGETAEAELRFTRATQLAPERADAHGDLGLVLLHSGRRERAEAELRIAARLDPKDANIRFNLAVALLAGNKLQEARAEADALRLLDANLGKELDALLRGR